MPEINIYAQKVPKVLVGTKSDLLQTEKKAEKKKKTQNVETDRTVKQKEVDSVPGSTHRLVCTLTSLTAVPGSQI